MNSGEHGNNASEGQEKLFLTSSDAPPRRECEQSSSSAGPAPSPSWGYLPPSRPSHSRNPSHDAGRERLGDRDRDRDVDPSVGRAPERDRSRQRHNTTASAPRSTSGTVRVCKRCREQLTGQFVRALDGTFHLDCFRCRDCGEIVASKFFPADDGDGQGQYPLCETDYFRRLDLLCHKCGGALRGSYITALDRKYHVDHFTCSLCPTIFGAQDSYYEHDGEVYCHYHYSTKYAQRCNGCQTAILKQFVEIYRNGQNQHWHPECYMIHKFWNVRLSPPIDGGPKRVVANDDEAGRELVRAEEERMEDKVYRIWSVLSTFEESSAACISDMLLHVSNAAYTEGVLVARRFIWHVEILFKSADRLDVSMLSQDMRGLSYGREAKLLCKKIVSFFSMLSKAQDNSTSRKIGVTQELLALVTGLAHYLKLLIRICLQGALKLERERQSSDGLYRFLEDLAALDVAKADESSLTGNGMARLAANDSDHCLACHKPIEDECVRTGDKRWHLACAVCLRCGRELGATPSEARLNQYDQKILCISCLPPGVADRQVLLERVTKLQQYVFLLRVALARLLEILRSTGVIGHLSEELGRVPGETQGQGVDAPRRMSTIDALPSHLHDEVRPGTQDKRRESSYENTLNDVRRLRSTRLDKHLSSSFRKARASRVLDGTSELGPDMLGGDYPEATTESMLGHENALTLDDIPRIVAAEQAAQRPNAYKQPRPDLYRSPTHDTGPGAPHLMSLSGGREGSARSLGYNASQRQIGRKFFSELSGLEYFIVRHIAVLTMHPMVENEFPLEELLSFIESRKQNTFWNKFAKSWSKADVKKGGKKKGVFGVPLEIIIDRDGAESTDGVGPGALRIPAIIDDIIATMRKMDLSVEGVFRKNGNIKKLTELAERIDRDGCDGISWMDYPVVQLAALLKKYLRELPDPLMTHKLYRLWVAAAKIPDIDKRRHCLHLTCCLLPKPHRDSLEILFSFLKWAGSFHQIDEEAGSKMDIRNLATVITPNILYSNTKIPGLDGEPMVAIDAVEDLITFNEEMCLVPEGLVELLSDPTLCTGVGELSTKEILKRLGDRTKLGMSRPFSQSTEFYGRQDNSVRATAKTGETDPHLWQQQSSARPMQVPGPMPYAHASTTSGRTTPQRYRSFDDDGRSSSSVHQPGEQPPSFDKALPRPTSSNGLHDQQPQQQQQQQDQEQPQQQPAASNGEGQRKEWRNSGWRQNNSVGVL